MSEYTENIAKKLNKLLEKNYDAEKGYKKAAENVEMPGLKNYFERKSQERYNFGHELKNELSRYGQKIDKGGSAAGSLHRAWMDIKAALSSNSEESMLEEAIRGEKASVEEYNEVINDSSVPMSTKNILMSQRDKIQASLSTIKRLEDLQ